MVNSIPTYRRNKNHDGVGKDVLVQDTKIWQRAANLSIPPFELADSLDRKHKYRFVEQLRSAVLSITNNIAEGSGSTSNTDFRNFLKYSRQSIVETANILIILSRAHYIKSEVVIHYINELEKLSKMIFTFMRFL